MRTGFLSRVTAQLLRRLQSTLAEIARLARKHWAQFNQPAMVAGIVLLAGLSLQPDFCCHRHTAKMQ